MKRLLLAAVLCAAAFAVVPIATASAADSFSGTCKVTGIATFTGGAGFTGLGFDAPLPPVAANYAFEQTETTCVGTAKKYKCVKVTTPKTGHFEDSSCTKLAPGEPEGEGEYDIGCKKEAGEFLDSKCTEPKPGGGGEYKAEVEKESVGPFTVLEAKVANGSGNLECGTSSKDGAADKEFEKATATIKLKVGADTYTAVSYFEFKPATAEGAPVAGEIQVRLFSEEGATAVGSNDGYRAKGRANFVEPFNKKAVEDCAKHTALELPFTTEETKAAHETRKTAGEGLESGLTGQVGPRT